MTSSTRAYSPSVLAPSPRVLRILGAAGVLGGLLYLSGDFLYYGTLDSGAFSAIAVMRQRDDAVLALGGAVAPLASAGYILGTLALAFALRAKFPRLAATFFACWTGMFLVGIAYHAVYATRGFAAKIPDPASAQMALARIGGLLTSLYAAEAALGVAGTLALVIAILRGIEGTPRWLLLFLPTAWSLVAAITRPVPAPLGSVLAGGWINGSFTLFFAACLLARRRSSASSERRAYFPSSSTTRTMARRGSTPDASRDSLM